VFTPRKNCLSIPQEKKTLKKEERLRKKKVKKSQPAEVDKYFEKEDRNQLREAKEKKENFISKKDKTKVIKKIREILFNISNLNICLININEEEGKEEIYGVNSLYRDKITLTYEETLNPEIFPWYMLKGVTRLSPLEAFKLYSKELVLNHEAFNRIILKRPVIKLKKKKNKAIAYCECKSTSEDDTMIGKFNFK
jgi:hypothetical protein